MKSILERGVSFREIPVIKSMGITTNKLWLGSRFLEQAQP